ncbi:beta-ketoacyl synthase chain length factor [Taibaiella koreensis]|uniref:beta-ketoacyl synthase chain length factor n=1 Tax=Taibaiella koreensis TaxID=1268548 RepID=UPI000E59B0DE|nr:beta-ketoacyl synthase chain length factor [Taibaiella koreensis]
MSIQMKMYINHFCSISPAGMLVPGVPVATLQQPGPGKAACAEPDYKELIPPMQLRRMTKPVRTGIAAAKHCLGTEIPGSIHVGTTYGMLQDSEQFLQKMIDQEEQMLNPTAFIQSTHNTVSGQIALSLACTGHNMTYVHKAHSFESAMMDAAMMLAAQPGEMVLAGAVDECTDTSYTILERFGKYKTGDIAGEGAAFFTLSAHAGADSSAWLRAFDMFVADDDAAVAAQLARFQEQHQLAINHNDILLINAPGLKNAPDICSGIETIDYRRYCGAYPTASSFGLALATALLNEKRTGRCWILSGWGDHYSIFCLDSL